MPRHSHLSICLALSTTIGCSASNLGGGSSSLAGGSRSTPSEIGGNNGKKPASIIDIGGLKEATKEGGVITVESPFDVGENGSIELNLEGGFFDRSKDEKLMRPLVVYFVLDVTGSMAAVLGAIRNGIQSFSEKLIAKKFDVKFGFLTFDDVVSSPSALSDASILSTGLGSTTNIAAGAGGDANEAALLGFKNALDFVLLNSDKDAVKALLTITDNPAHIGTPVPRDCAVTPVVNAVNAIPKDQQELVKVFHSVAQTAGTSCGGFGSARQQWDAILAGILPTLPEASRGGALPFPFNGDVLVNDFVTSLEKTAPGAELACLVKKVDLMTDEDVFDTLDLENFEDSYQKLKNGTPITWTDAVPHDKTQEFLEAKSNSARLTLCCVTKTNAESGKFDTCVEEKAVQVNFTLKSK